MGSYAGVTVWDGAAAAGGDAAGAGAAAVGGAKVSTASGAARARPAYGMQGQHGDEAVPIIRPPMAALVVALTSPHASAPHLRLAPRAELPRGLPAR